MIIGFTGTQAGTTPYQREICRKFLTRVLAQARSQGDKAEFHHGDCTGADDEIAQIAKELGFWIESHPPVNNKKRAWVKSDIVHPPLPYLERNLKIATVCDQLLACPKENKEVLRSGTWSTVRYAKKLNKPRMIVFPTGTPSLFAS